MFKRDQRDSVLIRPATSACLITEIHNISFKNPRLLQRIKYIFHYISIKEYFYRLSARGFYHILSFSFIGGTWMTQKNIYYIHNAYISEFCIHILYSVMRIAYIRYFFFFFINILNIFSMYFFCFFVRNNNPCRPGILEYTREWAYSRNLALVTIHTLPILLVKITNILRRKILFIGIHNIFLLDIFYRWDSLHLCFRGHTYTFKISFDSMYTVIQVSIVMEGVFR